MTFLALLVFDSLGWLHVRGAGTHPTETANLLSMLIVAGLMYGVGEILELGFAAVLKLSGGVALVLFPVLYVASGFARLEAAHRLLGKWFWYDRSMFPKILAMSIVLGATRWHLSRESDADEAPRH